MNNDSIINYINKLKNLAYKFYSNKEYEKSMAAIKVCADILYKCNLYYKDDLLEDILLNISKDYFFVSNDYIGKDKVVIFYDGFGLDIRGIAIIFLRAILQNGYKLIYVTRSTAKGNQPEICKVLRDYNNSIIEYLYYSGDYITNARNLQKIFYKHKPGFAFLYTHPSDVSGIVVFNSFKNYVIRHQIDLTDHAFWLGINAFDYVSAGREYAVSILRDYRGIEIKKIMYKEIVPPPYVPDVQFSGLPFDSENFICSGGALYKTLGDEHNYFYKIIDFALSKFVNLVFYYMGNGDGTEIKKLIKKFPNRVFWTEERKDFFEVIKRAKLFINTYPMFGGQMMRYAAFANKLPLTLIHNNEQDGILIKQKDRNIEYNSYDMLVDDLYKLLSDKHYLNEREKQLYGSVYTENQFMQLVKNFIECNKDEFIDLKLVKITKVDVNKFKKEYLERYSIKDLCMQICDINMIKLFVYFPFEYLYGFVLKVRRKLIAKFA